ncbi:MAG: hypothetical protein ACOY71_03640 [Gemmatimonadota bacterium]
MSRVRQWALARTARAPEALRQRVLERLGDPADDAIGGEALAAAGRALLEDVMRGPGDRSVALDLLAADALITLALLARAEVAPETLGRFAESLLMSPAPAR